MRIASVPDRAPPSRRRALRRGRRVTAAARPGAGSAVAAVGATLPASERETGTQANDAHSSTEEAGDGTGEEAAALVGRPQRPPRGAARRADARPD